LTYELNTKRGKHEEFPIAHTSFLRLYPPSPSPPVTSAAAEKWAKEAIEAEDMDESDDEEGGAA